MSRTTTEIALIQKAKFRLLSEYKIDEPTAYLILRSTAMENRITLIELATGILHTSRKS